MNLLRRFTKRNIIFQSTCFLRGITEAAKIDKERIQYDVCIVGGGPAGLSAAIKTKQLAKEKNLDVSVCIVEKGPEIGSHIISGCVMDPRSLEELIPDWKSFPDLPASLTPAKVDKLRFLTEQRSVWIPVIPQLRNKGAYILSLSEFCRWLGNYAESLGVDLFPGFAAEDVLQNPDGAVKGVSINHKGIDKNGNPKNSFEPGVLLESRVTLLAEGCRGSISQKVMKAFNLREDVEQQTYGLGVKEVWEVPEKVHEEGTVIHTIGYPLTRKAFGGGFLYHMAKNKVSVGLVTGLNYENPYLSPFEEFQAFKSHPFIREVLQGGTCLEYGARALNEGGLQSLPKLNFPGGALLGCGAGFMNSLRLKGSHGAMKSGLLAAEVLFDQLTSTSKEEIISMEQYPIRFKNSWLYDELYAARNARPQNRSGLILGSISAAFHSVIFRGNEPWTFKNRNEDHEAMQTKERCNPIEYPKPDNEITFDRNASLYRSGTNHDHDQPTHLKVLNPDLQTEINLKIFDGPETKYCPAGVYEYVEDENHKKKLQINGQNCLHCKACDIKDPMKNIKWTVPEGADGPNYTIL